MKHIFWVLLLSIGSLSAQDFDIEEHKTSNGTLKMTFIGHGSLMFEFDGKTIHIDPSGREADYAQLPQADLVLITHHHGDHCDPEAIMKINTDKTNTYLTALAAEKITTGNVLANGESASFEGIKIEAIPAYNLVHKRSNGDFFHPKGCCNSYVLTIDGLRVFIGGDTENTPEMKALKNIDIAFLPMNLPYTMTPEMVADATKAFRPRILYPYHYGSTDTNIILDLLKEEKDIEVRIHKM